MNTTELRVNHEDRVLRSSISLKTYFECQWAVSLDLLTEAPPLSGALRFAVPFSGRLQKHGLWGVEASRELIPAETNELQLTFDTIIGGVFELKTRFESGVEIEAALDRLREDTPPNILPFRRRLKTSAGFDRITDKRWIFRSDCLIESNDPAEIRKMAFELHSHSNRYAFLNFDDINLADRTRVTSLMALGAVTLFISDVSELPENIQTALLILCTQPAIDRPLIMAGTGLTYADLRDLEFLNPTLIQQLSQVYIKLTRPVSSYRDEGLIHYFLDSLSESPS